jgi:hypothetical protein
MLGVLERAKKRKPEKHSEIKALLPPYSLPFFIGCEGDNAVLR